MYIGLKQPRGDGERYVTPARAAAKETTLLVNHEGIPTWRLYTELCKFVQNISTNI